MLAVFTLCFAATAGAQATVKGTVVDADSNEPLIGATVTYVRDYLEDSRN